MLCSTASAVQQPSVLDRQSGTIRCVLQVGAKRIEFDLSKRDEIERLEQMLETETISKEVDQDSPNQKGSHKRAHRGFKEIKHLAKALLDSAEPSEAQRLQNELLEAAAAVNNLSRRPVPRRVDFFETPIFFLRRQFSPIGRGRTPASNLVPGDQPDLSLLDPEPTSFWQRPKSISTQDLYHGFGRTNLMLESKPISEYSAPKESFGRNPGFEIECQGTKLKLKFAEVSSEPFAARIFSVLGFHTDPIDYAPGVKIRYSRRIFQEFNLRKPLQTHFTFLSFVPLFTMELQQHYDPFEYVSAAVLTNGTSWSGQELKKHLLRNLAGVNPEMDAANFRPEVESAIEYLVTGPASVQQKIGKSIGPWDFGDLDHASRREIRGAGLLAAWLGWFDTRFDNTRVRIVQGPNGHELEHYFSDLGGVLGETKGLLYARGELPNAFPWAFTRAPLWQGEHHLAKPLRIVGYKPIARVPAFVEMTIDDARWMARLIGALSEHQIEQALVASGFDSARTRLLLEKLLSRRDQMVRDLALANEIPLTRPAGVNRHFSYDATTEGNVRVNVQGRIVEAPSGTDRVINGRLATAGTSRD